MPAQTLGTPFTDTLGRNGGHRAGRAPCGTQAAASGISGTHGGWSPQAVTVCAEGEPGAAAVLKQYLKNHVGIWGAWEKCPYDCPTAILGAHTAGRGLSTAGSPYHCKGVRVGAFDSARCQFCGFYVLSDEGRIKSVDALFELGLISLEEDTTETVTPVFDILCPAVTQTSRCAARRRDGGDPGQRRSCAAHGSP